MQGPRLPSHGAGRQITLQRLASPEKKEHEQDGQQPPEADDGIRHSAGSSAIQPDMIEVLHDPGEPPSTRCRDHDDDEKQGAFPDTCWKGSTSRNRLDKAVRWSRRHLRFVGPGLIASAAYLDPGNYATNLAAGATNGYKLLFIVLLSGLIGIMMQILAARLGIVTGKDIGQLCRQSLHSRSRHTMFYRWGMLYPLYIIAEAGIIFADLAELLGTAIAFNLLIPKIPLYAGVLLTSLDVFVVLAVFNTYPGESRNKSITAFEILISIMILVVLSSFVVLLVRLSPDWSDVFDGYLPSSSLVGPGALYLAVGIIGATVMPHALFLGAKLGTIRRIEEVGTEADDDEESLKVGMKDASTSITNVNEVTTLSGGVLLAPRPSRVPGPERARSTTNTQLHAPSLHLPQPIPMPQYPMQETPKSERSARFIRIHLHHAQIDIAQSLFCFALVTNSAILTVAGAAFYYGNGGEDESGVQEGDLFSAHQLIKTRVGSAFAFLFALALMMSGQAASITATLAGQVVSEGFINWRTTPWKRRLITRCISMIPALVVAVAVGQKGVNTLLVASQVTLSLVLPFVLGPLIAFTCLQRFMSIPRPESEQLDNVSATAREKQRKTWVKYLYMLNPFGSRIASSAETISFANNWFIVSLGCAIFAVICIADVYALVQLGRGET